MPWKTALRRQPKHQPSHLELGIAGCSCLRVCETSVSQLSGQGGLCCHEGPQGQAQQPPASPTLDNPRPLPPRLPCHPRNQLLSLSGQDRPGLRALEGDLPPSPSSHPSLLFPEPWVGGPVMHHTQRVKAARSKFCPQMSSSDHGCVHKDQDSSSQPCPDGNTELPVDHRPEIPVELSVTSFWPNLCLFQKTASPSFPSTGWGMQRFVQKFVIAQLNHPAPLKHLEPMGVRSLQNIRLDLI